VVLRGAESRGTDGILYLCNGREEKELPVSRRVVAIFAERSLLDDFRIEEISHHIDIPQGSGFGSSGAGALSLSLALNSALASPLGRAAAGEIAHQAEVECGTGLGTVIGEYYGGFEIRTRAGAPGFGRVVPIPADENLHILFVVYRKISTKTSLADPRIRERINRTGEGLIADLLLNPSLEGFLWASRAFSERSGLVTPEVRTLFDRFDRIGAPCAMLMFGNAAFALFRSGEAAAAEAAALSREAKKGYLFITTPSKQGGAVIHE
jgi:pantoate kinase